MSLGINHGRQTTVQSPAFRDEASQAKRGLLPTVENSRTVNISTKSASSAFSDSERP
jgi:hypothetical protein